MTVQIILVVAGEEELRTAIVEQLAMIEEFETLEAMSSAECIEYANKEHIDLILIDSTLPDLNGEETENLLRNRGFRAPIVLMSESVDESDAEQHSMPTASESIRKPFKFSELIALIRNGLRQFEQSEDAKIEIGQYEFSPMAKLLTDKNGKKIRLTEKETAILKFLHRSGEKPVSRDVLLHRIWGYNSGVTTHTLETHIYGLRQKIEDDPYHAIHLVTKDGGYMLVSLNQEQFVGKM